jgi:hypothetical protein
MGEFWATITEDGFPGVPDGQHDVKMFNKGDTVFGDLAKAAISLDMAKEGKGDPPHVKAPPADDKTSTATTNDGALAELRNELQGVAGDVENLHVIINHQHEFLLMIGLDKEFAEALRDGVSTDDQIDQMVETITKAREAKTSSNTDKPPATKK